VMAGVMRFAQSGDGLRSAPTYFHTLKRATYMPRSWTVSTNAQQRTRTDACQKYDHVKLACEKSRGEGSASLFDSAGLRRIEGATRVCRHSGKSIGEFWGAAAFQRENS